MKRTFVESGVFCGSWFKQAVIIVPHNYKDKDADVNLVGFEGVCDEGNPNTTERSLAAFEPTVV